MPKPLLAAAIVLAIAPCVFVASSAVAQPAVQPGFDTAPEVSPDGRWLLFKRLYEGGSRYAPPNESVRIAPVGGSPERELVPRREGQIAALWTPDNLVQVTVENQTRLLRPEDGSVAGRMPVAADAWSPNGKWIAYVSGPRELYVSAPDGSSARRVAAADRLGSIHAGEFSPDSTRLSYSRSVGLDRDRSEVVRIDGTSRRLLREAPVAGAGRWSPAGTRLVLMAQGSLARPNRYEPPRLWLVQADGSRPRLLVPGHSSGAEWSPRGDWIAYTRMISTRLADIHELMIVRPSGAGRRRVVRGAGAGPWLADGRRLLSAGRGACWRSGVIEIDVFRRTVRRLTNRCSVIGTAGDDTLVGSPLRDLMAGLAGDDSLTGGGGHDRLSGGPGNDSHFAREGVGDTVLCGPGRDRVFADRRDKVARDCEQVRRA
jgi:RTX calcium-binding nonapeptide repeat (4 copies)/WD40-like Beta Propeller Repeat